MASFTYNYAKQSFGKAELNFLTDTIKVALVTSSYTPDQDTHQYFSDVTNEITGGGYTAGGSTLASKAININNTLNLAEFDAADVTLSSFTNIFRYGIVYKSTGVAATSRLIALIDFGSNVQVTASTYTITWNAAGIFYLGE